MFRMWVCLAAVLLLLSGCFRGGRSAVKIGVDSNWYPIDFKAQTPYVNGFVEELLLEISQQTGLQFEKIPGNGDSLFEGMKQGRYEAVLSSLPPYAFHKALYDFSHRFLDLGPVLIVPIRASQDSLKSMRGLRIGILTGDPADRLLQKEEGMIVRGFPSTPDLLDAVVAGSIEGAVLSRVEAGSYVNDLFMDKLKIIGPPLTDAGLYMVSLKGKQPVLFSQFNKGLALLKKKKRFQALLHKWQLGESS